MGTRLLGMPSLSLGTSSSPAPTTFSHLLDALQGRPQPALVYYSSAASPSDDEAAPGHAGERVELSGRVLQNWTVKLIGLLLDEADLQAGEVVLIDTDVHWKSLAVALAASALGCEVQLDVEADADYALVVTDDPGSWQDSDALGQAELAALSSGMLDSSFAASTGVDVPSWVLDVSAEVRQQPDQLLSPMPDVSLPEAALPPAGGAADAAQASSSAAAKSSSPGAPGSAGSPVVLFPDDDDVAARFADLHHWRPLRWGTAALPDVLAAWSAQQPVVCLDGALHAGAERTTEEVPADASAGASRESSVKDPEAHAEPLWLRMRRNEGMS